MKNLGGLKHFLGIEVARSKQDIFQSQYQYIYIYIRFTMWCGNARLQANKHSNHSKSQAWGVSKPNTYK
jgi:hypothetical protein